MSLPDVCYKCGKLFDHSDLKDETFALSKDGWDKYHNKYPYLNHRTKLEFDDFREDKIEKQLFECSGCHQLYVARYKMVSFKPLMERKIDGQGNR